MLERIGSYDAKTKLPEILRRVETGESFTITYRGKPIADRENQSTTVPGTILRNDTGRLIKTNIPVVVEPCENRTL